MSNRFSKILLTVVLAAASCFLCSGQGKKGVPIEMDKAMFIEKVADYVNNPDEFKYLGDKPALIDFYATWCGPCKQVAPIVADMAREFSGRIHVYKIDIDKEKELAKVFGIQSIPSFLFIPKKGEPKMIVGAMDRKTFREAVNTNLFGKD